MSFVLEKNDVIAQADRTEVVTAVVAIANVAGADDMNNSAKKDDDTISLSSSIGVLSDGDDEDAEESQSKVVPDEGSLTSLATLEDALPFKRGLSGFYDGKSRTFLNLAEVKTVKEIEKEESPLNKRRRLTISQTTLYKWGSRSSSSMPHLTPSDAEKTHSVGVKQDSKSSTSSTSFSSINSATKSFIN